MRQRRFEEHLKRGRGINLAADHPAVTEGRTLFPSTRKNPQEVRRVLKSGRESRKIGAQVAKGKWKGFPIFTLTLEERATCPTSCKEWTTCYGNNMHWSHRFAPTPETLDAIKAELGRHQKKYPGGFVVRLHVLGDFHSAFYVHQWRLWLRDFPALHIFGYTAHTRQSGVGLMLNMMSADMWDRFAIRFSHGVGIRSARVVEDAREVKAGEILCPAQTGKTDCCATCALCWQTDKPIVFLRH